MKALISKDIRLIGPFFNIFLLFAVSFYSKGIVIAAENKQVYIMANIVLASFMVSLVISILAEKDQKAKINNVLKSLPLSNYTIVFGRYIIILLYSSIFVLVSYFRKDYLGGFSFLYDINFQIYPRDMASILGVILILVAIYLPLYYKKEKNNNLLFLLLLILVLVFKFIYDRGINLIELMEGLDFEILGLGLLIYLLSAFISARGLKDV